MSATRKRYTFKLIGRCLIFLFCTVLCFSDPALFDVLDGMNFFRSFSVLHILWGIWILDMILQIIPIKNKLPIGSQKLFAMRFRPIQERINYEALKAYLLSTTKAAYKVFLLWCGLIGGKGSDSSIISS